MWIHTTTVIFIPLLFVYFINHSHHQYKDKNGNPVELVVLFLVLSYDLLLTIKYMK